MDTKTKRKIPILQEKSITATVIMIIVISVLFVAAYLRVADIMEKRCLSHMEESVQTATAEISSKLVRDSQILNATAEILSHSPELTPETVRDTMSSFAPLTSTYIMRVLLPDDTIIASDGTLLDSHGTISFAKEAPFGEHISDRVVSIMDDNTLVLRHYVPIVKDGRTVALLYGVTILEDMPNIMNVENVYNATASVYIIDTKTGDFIMDTYNPTLGNLNEHHNLNTRDGVNWEVAVQRIQSGQTGHVIFQHANSDEWMYLYYAPADINHWTIAISVPEAQAFASLYAIKRVCWVIAVLTAITIALYYIWVRKNAKEILERSVEKAVLEEKLHKAEAAERAKTTFLSNMSHDIRTPMNAIIGFTTLAQTHINSREKVQEYLSKILSSSNHLLSLINDILDMSRIESGRLNIEEKECSISDIFRDMRNIIQTQMQTKQLNFFMDTIDVVDEDIYCDKLHLNQILLNLLSNAIKFTPAGGSVSMTIRQHPGAPTGYGAYEIRVKDTGIGMSPEFAKHVFEPFERERNSTVSGIQGTGLGMAISKSIVDTMGGSIELQTEQGKGTEFIINFEFRLQTDHKPVESIQELQGLRALVVDDSFSTCDSVTKMLMKIGMRSEWTMHGKEAILRAKQALEMGDAFCAYVIDWSLPDMNGIEVARQIRGIVAENIPIIIMTAYDWSIIEDEAREAGVTAFCNKPLFLSDLRDTLVSVIHQTNEANETAILPSTTEDMKGKRLLLVEDTELNREIAEAILTESGFLVESAEDGTIAVDKVKASTPGYYDLILMDVQMPVMNGYEATKAIRALDDEQLSSIPIVAMTANAFDEDRKAALDSGMNAHIAKPIDVEKLIETLQEILSK